MVIFPALPNRRRYGVLGVEAKSHVNETDLVQLPYLAEEVHPSGQDLGVTQNLNYLRLAGMGNLSHLHLSEGLEASLLS
jgi:hypothetical protein